MEVSARAIGAPAADSLHFSRRGDAPIRLRMWVQADNGARDYLQLSDEQQQRLETIFSQLQSYQQADIDIDNLFAKLAERKIDLPENAQIKALRKLADEIMGGTSRWKTFPSSGSRGMARVGFFKNDSRLQTLQAFTALQDFQSVLIRREISPEERNRRANRYQAAEYLARRLREHLGNLRPEDPARANKVNLARQRLQNPQIFDLFALSCAAVIPEGSPTEKARQILELIQNKPIPRNKIFRQKEIIGQAEEEYAREVALISAGRGEYIQHQRQWNLSSTGLSEVHLIARLVDALDSPEPNVNAVLGEDGIFREVFSHLDPRDAEELQRGLQEDCERLLAPPDVMAVENPQENH